MNDSSNNTYQTLPLHEVKARFSEIVKLVLSGTQVTVTYFGNPAVKIVPCETTSPQNLSDRYNLLIQEGKVRAPGSKERASALQTVTDHLKLPPGSIGKPGVIERFLKDRNR